MTGEELLSLDDHNNVVYCMAFNNPFGDKIVTGSFDKKKPKSGTLTLANCTIL